VRTRPLISEAPAEVDPATPLRFAQDDGLARVRRAQHVARAALAKAV